MTAFPTALYDAAGTRLLDETAIVVHAMDGFDLMNRAGEAAFRDLCVTWPETRRIGIICGPGNNGGDGYIVAALASRQGIKVELAATAPPRSEASRRARDEALVAGVEAFDPDAIRFEECDVLVDAILGTGLSSAPRAEYARVIDTINRCAAPKFALDIPSGLDSDTGSAPGAVVNAAATSTFIGVKVGLLTGIGPECAGTVFFHDLGVPRSVYDAVAPRAIRIDESRVRAWLPRRGRCAHKGSQGHVVLLGGNDGMSGALAIACQSAARSGAGLVTGLSKRSTMSAINAHQPEIMTAAVDDGEDFDRLVAQRSALGVGPGLGRDAWAIALFERAVRCVLPKVIDADALNLLAQTSHFGSNQVLTPHPGEAARLLHRTIADIQADRLSAAREIAGRYGGICVLKGCGTVVADAESIYICDRGNPGMATGGMGDCLTGLIVALLGQGVNPLPAAVCGVWLHATAADREAGANGMVGMLATDLLPWLRKLMDPAHG